MGNMGMCDAMFVCLLNELSWEEKKLFVKLELVQRTLVFLASHWPSWSQKCSDWPKTLNQNFLWPGDF